MMPTVTIQEAQARLPELIHKITGGDEVVITENQRVVARLVLPSQSNLGKARELGTLRGTVLYMAPDFDAPLDDFKEYME
jgi:antitoxin (DNA-binding transcriptional repressor) of toxin-antitoxin stability system